MIRANLSQQQPKENAMKSHEYIEKRLGVLAALVVVVISFGGFFSLFKHFFL